MVILITGGSGSGKSEYGEQLVMQLEPKQRIYAATMICRDEESKKRVERHKRMRQGKHFQTVECPVDLEKLDLNLNPGETSTVLLECLSNLAANEMFRETGKRKDVEEAVMEGLFHLQKQVTNLMIITNEIFSDGEDYGRETAEYQRILGSLKRRLAKMADQVYEVVYGIPICIKNSKKERLS